MKTKFFNSLMLALLICIASSFLIAPKIKNISMVSVNQITTTPECVVTLVATDLPAGCTVSGLRANPQGGGAPVYFTQSGNSFTHATMAGNWFLNIQVTGVFGSLIHQLNIPTHDSMSGAGSGATAAWFAVWDAPFTFSTCTTNKIYFCTTPTCF